MAQTFLGHPEGRTSFRKQDIKMCMKAAVEEATLMHAHIIKQLGLDLDKTVWMFRLHEVDAGPHYDQEYLSHRSRVDIRITAYPVVKKTATGSQLYVWQAKRNKFITDGPKRASSTTDRGAIIYTATEPTQKAWASTDPNAFIGNYVWRKRAQWDIHRKIASRAETAFLMLASTEYDHTRIDPTL